MLLGSGWVVALRGSVSSSRLPTPSSKCSLRHIQPTRWKIYRLILIWWSLTKWMSWKSFIRDVGWQRWEMLGATRLWSLVWLGKRHREHSFPPARRAPHRWGVRHWLSKRHELGRGGDRSVVQNQVAQHVRGSALTAAFWRHGAQVGRTALIGPLRVGVQRLLIRQVQAEMLRVGVRVDHNSLCRRCGPARRGRPCRKGDVAFICCRVVHHLPSPSSLWAVASCLCRWVLTGRKAEIVKFAEISCNLP